MPLDFDHPALIKADPSSVIYRYIDLEKFEYFLKDRALFFCRADKFSDPFEASTLRKEAEYRIIENINLAKRSNRLIDEKAAREQSDGLASLHKRLRKTFVVNCWHLNNSESDAMWRLYLKTNEGVAIQSTVQRLTYSFDKTADQVYISKVRYLNYDSDIYYDPIAYPDHSYNLLVPIVHKRRCFFP